MHQAFQHFMADVGRLYIEHSALWELDASPEGFSWIDCQDAESSIISYVRYGKESHLVCVFNLTPVPREGYRIGVPGQGSYRERINSDSTYYGGSDIGNQGHLAVHDVPFHGFSQSVLLSLPPLACLILEQVV
jgi:1,4-alpha-glucan branching enzyme